jgi:heptosyltransferase-1
VVAWGPGEIERAERVVEQTRGAARLAPSTTILELCLLLGNASLVVGGDTGPVHLAASLGTPTLAIFLASDWRRNGPLGAHTAVVAGTADAGGAPRGSAKARPTHRIGTAEIVAAAHSLLDE